MCYHVLSLYEKDNLQNAHFAGKVLERIMPYTFISHIKMSIILGTCQSTNYTVNTRI